MQRRARRGGGDARAACVDRSDSTQTLQKKTHTQTNLRAAHGAELTRANISLGALRAASVAVATRYMAVAHRGLSHPVMVPLLDCGNHHNACPNWYEFRPCSVELTPGPRLDWDPDAQQAEADAASPDELCAFWVAALDVEPGDEACLNYGYLTPDLVRAGRRLVYVMCVCDRAAFF